MSEWKISTACSMELAPFARANGVVVEVDPEQCLEVLERMPHGDEGEANLLVRATMVDHRGGTSTYGRMTTKEDINQNGENIDCRVDVAIGDKKLPKTITSKPTYPVIGDNAVKETVAHEFQHVIDRFVNPDGVWDEDITHLMLHEDGKTLRMVHSFFRHLPTFGERFMALTDVVMTRNLAYSALIAAVLIKTTIVTGIEEKRQDKDYYFNEDPSEIRAREAETRAEEYMPVSDPAPVRLSAA